jgi:Uma2 family endonuclease
MTTEDRDGVASEGPMMSVLSNPRATLADLAKVSDKAELIAGRIVCLMPTGRRPGRLAFRIARSLDDFARANKFGEVYGDNVGYAVPELTSGRESFAPDASLFLGPFPANSMSFLEGPPHFAVEVRSEGDYGPGAEKELAAKRADYFEAGTLVVWDVDPKMNCIRCYRAAPPDQPTVFQPGQKADAEPAVSNWRLDVADLFAEA